MARVYGIKKRLAENGADEKLVKEIIGTGDLVGIIARMDERLEPDLVCRILDSCGCTGGREYLKQCEKTGKLIAGKTMEEKIRYLNGESDTFQIALNGDNTVTVNLFFKGDGKYGCSCSAAVRNGVKVSDLASPEAHSDGRAMPLTYCFCCAGSCRLHSQLKLGIQLKTREIVSSPINSKGEKPCVFIYEIV